MSTPAFDPTSVDLTSADPTEVVCFLNASSNEYNGHLGARVSALFVILIVSTVVTFFPVAAKRITWLRIPLYVYLFARYFGAGVIVATAFIHLLDPAYSEIGPQTCVGMTGHWADYSWVPAIALGSVMLVFLLDFGAERYVETKYGIHYHEDVQERVTGTPERSNLNDDGTHGISTLGVPPSKAEQPEPSEPRGSSGHGSGTDVEAGKTLADEYAFTQQIAAFLILEFGVIFHSVIIGLNLGTVGDEFGTLYVVIVFHQAFEGLGIGAPYGLTTPIAIAIGLGLRTTYDAGSFTANVVSGVLDSLSAGILIYTGLVELLARDFLFNPHRTQDNRQLTFMVFCVFLGAGIMALLGKWA
ncbi:MAG: high-affinity Zn(2+) transporter zrt1 [Thelocarpon superellum]|nr:MAG: high-affinity Zn(2+) transporter zrt1 [Thelocarpon superellum]